VSSTSHIAFSKILEKCAEYETSPRFFREDSDVIRRNVPNMKCAEYELAEVVPLWMSTTVDIL
jgi:hypothetical protein